MCVCVQWYMCCAPAHPQQPALPSVTPSGPSARAVGHRPVLEPLNREKSKLPTLFPSQLVPTNSHTERQGGEAVPAGGGGGVRPTVGLPGSMLDDLRFTMHGRCGRKRCYWWMACDWFVHDPRRVREHDMACVQD